MKIIVSYSLFESTLGTEEIRKKWYPNIDRKLFLQIVNLDPTSIRKQNFSKPGKFSKWLLMRMIDKNTNRLTDSGSYFLKNEKDQLSFYLFIFNTGWYRIKEQGEKDILKFKTLNDFIKHMSQVEKKYLLQTKAKYDIIYSDDKIDIVVPLNYTASFETAKNTDWCTKNVLSYEVWSSKSILFRIMPKSKNFQKMKLSWGIVQPYMWTMASEKYPEISGIDNPFEMVGKKEKWCAILDDKIIMDTNANKELNAIWREQGYATVSEEPNPTYAKLRETAALLSDEAKAKIINHFNIYKT